MDPAPKTCNLCFRHVETPGASWGESAICGDCLQQLDAFNPKTRFELILKWQENESRRMQAEAFNYIARSFWDALNVFTDDPENGGKYHDS